MHQKRLTVSIKVENQKWCGTVSWIQWVDIALALMAWGFFLQNSKDGSWSRSFDCRLIKVDPPAEEKVASDNQRSCCKVNVLLLTKESDFGNPPLVLGSLHRWLALTPYVGAFPVGGADLGETLTLARRRPSVSSSFPCILIIPHQCTLDSPLLDTSCSPSARPKCQF